MKTILTLSTLLLVACGQADQGRISSTLHSSESAASLVSTVTGNSQFALDLFGTVAKNEKTENVFIAPYSVSSALAMTYAGSRNDTEKQMSSVLHFVGEQKDVHTSFKNLNSQIASSKNSDGFELRTANRLWGQQGFPFKPDFLATTKDNYGAGLQTLDFKANVEGSRQAINKWVEDQTNQKIENLIPEGTLSSDARLVLTNAIYFLGQWAHQFEVKGTTKASFTNLDNQKVTVDMMHQTGYFKYVNIAAQGLEALELPYMSKSSKSASMIILLPKDSQTLSRISNNLTAEQIKTILSQMNRTHVSVAMPKFKIEGSFSLGEVLQTLGMTDAFAADKADFRNMAELGADENLYISKVVHKTFLQVDEGGTEAAGATAVVMNYEATSFDPTPIVSFTMNKPFMLMIKDNATNSVLFMGRIADPTK